MNIQHEIEMICGRASLSGVSSAEIYGALRHSQLIIEHGWLEDWKTALAQHLQGLEALNAMPLTRND